VIDNYCETVPIVLTTAADVKRVPPDQIANLPAIQRRALSRGSGSPDFS
jgi:hypothetical protein